MILPRITPLPFGFQLAKLISIFAVKAIPLLFVVAAFRQSADILLFAIVSMIAIPFMAMSGFWMSLFVYSGFQNSRTDDLMDLFPSHWHFPFSLLNVIHRQSQSKESPFALLFINVFVVLWSSFLLLWVIAAIVLGLCGQLRA